MTDYVSEWRLTKEMAIEILYIDMTAFLYLSEPMGLNSHLQLLNLVGS